MIYIHSSGASTAGQAYILICTATVVENLIVEPTLEWLDTDRRVVGGNDITVGSSVTTGTNTTLILTFDPLHTSHGGKYTCRASINISAISLSNSNDLDSDVVVQSESFECVCACVYVASFPGLPTIEFLIAYSIQKQSGGGGGGGGAWECLSRE